MNGDTVVEPNELLSLTLSNVSAGGRTVTISDGTATGTITNDDTSTTALSIGDVELVEGNDGTTNMVFTVTLVNPPSTGDVTVQFTTGGGTATAGTDYTTTTGTLTFAQGTTTRTISVPIVGDTMFEPNENFNVTLSNSTNAVISDATAVGTITNDDTTTASLSIGPATLIEGNNGTTNMTFTVTLTNPAATGATTVNFATSNGTATAGTDYTATNGTLTFAQGETSRTFTVPITGDTTVEPDETFTVTLSNSSNAMIGTASATGTITNDDQAAASLSIGPGTLVEGNTGQANMMFTVTLSNPPSTGSVTVNYSMAAGTATAGTDYTSSTGTLTFPQGTTTQTIVVPVIGDTTPEQNETFTITLASPSGAVIGTSTATGTIVNDDGPTLAITESSRVEGNDGTANMQFTVTLTNPPPTGDVTVQFTTTAGTATAGTDYTTTTGTLTFPQGTTTQTINVPILGDATSEENEAFTVTLSSPSGATISTASVTGTIINDDGPTLAIAAASLLEGNSGTANMQFTVTLTNPPSTGSVTVQFTTNPGTAFAGSDYTTTTGTLTFPQGTTTQTINIPIVGDTTVEPNELFTITLSNATGETISTGAANGTITNDDGTTASLAIAANSRVEGDSGTANLVFTVTLTNPPASGDVTVQFNTGGGTAQAGTDYTTTSGTLTFPQGTTTQTINVPIVGDTNDEADETFIITLSNPSGAALGTATATGTITDDDTAPAASLAIVATRALAEGNSGSANMEFTVTLTNPPSTGDVTVQFTTGGGNATAGTDYTTTSGTLTFPQGTTTQTIIVPIAGDNTVEQDETFNVTLSNPTGATIGAGVGASIGTITNDDTAAITFLDETIEGLESAGDQTFTLVLSNPVDVDITLTFNDEVENQTVTIPAGSTTKTVLAIVDDNDIVQEDLPYIVTLSNLQASSRSVTIGDANATGTILDDDFADVEISNVTLAEGNSGTTNFTFTVTLTNEVEANVTMTVAVAGVTATVGEDFVAPTITTIGFAPGETSKTFTVVVNGDTVVEPNETFSVTLSDLDAEGLEDPTIEAVIFSGGGTTLVATGTITNDDAAAAASIIAFAPAGRGLPGESNYTVGGGGTQAVAHATLDTNAVDEAFALTVTGSLSAGNESRRSSPADEAFDDTTDWLN